VTEAPRLFANLGAEEGEPADRAAPGDAEAAARAWRALFDPPAYDWLAPDGKLFAWLNTESAQAAAEATGATLFGAAPAVVRRVHDKAFAHAVACRESLLPEDLARAIAVFDPEHRTLHDYLASTRVKKL